MFLYILFSTGILLWCCFPLASKNRVRCIELKDIREIYPESPPISLPQDTSNDWEFIL